MNLGFELAGRFVSERRVFAVGVVVTFDVFEDFGPGVSGVTCFCRVFIIVIFYIRILFQKGK